MVKEILLLILCIVCGATVPFLAWLEIWQFNKERTEWSAERAKLLDRIQAGNLGEYKAQERADKPVKRVKKDPETARLENEPWA